MKGIAHFAAGIAAASCLPAVVRAGAAGNPLYFVLAGFFGLLPDTLDFKFYRYFYRHDMEVIPDPNKPDAQIIAQALANAAVTASQTGRPVRIKLNTIRLAADQWQRYEVRFNVADQSVSVVYGPVVDTGGSRVSGQEPAEQHSARADMPCPISLDYRAVTVIDAFDGPLFELRPTESGRIKPLFIPWHRHWSHSLVFAALFGLLGAALWDGLAGLVIAFAYSLHILLDQLGFMGSNLWFPFRKSRTPGLGLVHSAEPAWNLLAVWLSCVVVFWNLYSSLSWNPARFNAVTLCFYALILPAGTVALVRKLLRKHAPPT